MDSRWRTKLRNRRQLGFERLEQRTLLAGVDLVSTCGAVGDGLTNDHAALQRCIQLLPHGGEIHVPEGDFLIDGPVFLGANVSLMGGGANSRLLLNTDLRSTEDPHGFWFNLGITEKGGAGVAFEGRLQDLHFQLLPHAGFQSAIGIHAGDKFAIHNNIFDARQSEHDTPGSWMSWIHALPTSIYRRGGTGRIEDGSIFNNVFYAAHVDGTGEQISLGAGVSTLIVADNDFQGSRRSCVGVHGADKVVISSNRCQATQRAITINGGSDITVANNHIQIVSNAAGDWVTTGEFIVAESLTPTQLTERLVITNNQLLNPRGSKASFGIRLRGVQDAVISDNWLETNAPTQLSTSTLDHFYGITVEPRPFSGGEIPFESVVIQNNQLFGSSPPVIWKFGRREYGPLIVQSNVAGGYQLYGDVIVGDNQLSGAPSNPLRVEGGHSPSDVLLLEASAGPLSAGQSVLATDANGLDQFLTTHHSRITRIEVVPHQPVDAGRLVPTIVKSSGDYLPPAGTHRDGEITFGYDSPYHYETPNLGIGEALQLRLTATDDFTSGDGDPVASTIRVYAMRAETSPSHGPNEPHIQTGTLRDIDENWQTIELNREYLSPVVVTTIHQTVDAPPLVARLRNVAGSQFEIQVVAMDDSVAFDPVDVSFVAVEEGVYSRANHGVTMEAVRADSPSADVGANWIGEARTFQNSYHEPVVLGQVQSANDVRPTVFWASAANTNEPPKRGELRVGAHIGEDSVTSRVPEQIGYIVIESSRGRINGTTYVADTQLTSDLQHPAKLPERMARTAAVIATQGGLAGADPSWAVATGAASVAVDEDRWTDAERTHGTETISYAMFGEQLPRQQQRQHINVELCGAVGDGVTDNATAFQACIDLMPAGGVLQIPTGIFQVNQQIFVPADVSLAGEGPGSILELDADLMSPDPHWYGFWWNFGLAQPGTDGRFYSGEVRDLTFRLTENARTFRALEFHTSDTVAIYRNFFDGSDVAADIPISWISSQTVDAYQTAKHHQTKKNGLIYNNHFVLNQTQHGGEQIGLGAFAEHFVLANNSMEGNGDDCVGLHSTLAVVVAHNTCSSVDGRILVEKSIGTVVVDNELTRIPDVNGNWGPAGAYIYAANYGASFHDFSNARELVVAHNTIANPAQSLATYGIRLQGTSEAVVSHNEIQTESLSYVSPGNSIPFMGVLVQDQTGPNAHLAEHVAIVANRVVGSVEGSIQMLGSGQSGPILVHDNTADNFQFYGNALLGDSQAIGPDKPTLKLEGDSSLRDQVVFEGRVANLGAAQSQFGQRSNGDFFVSLAESMRITRVEIFPDAVPTTGRLLARIHKPGGGTYQWDTNAAVDTVMSFGYRSHFYRDDSDVDVGDLQLEILGTDDLSEAIDAMVRVYGI